MNNSEHIITADDRLQRMRAKIAAKKSQREARQYDMNCGTVTEHSNGLVSLKVNTSDTTQYANGLTVRERDLDGASVRECETSSDAPQELKESTIVTDVEIPREIARKDDSNPSSIHPELNIASGMIPHCTTFKNNRFKSKRFLISYKANDRSIGEGYTTGYRPLFTHFDELKQQRSGGSFQLKSFAMSVQPGQYDNRDVIYLYVEFRKEIQRYNTRWLPRLAADGPVIVLKPKATYTAKASIIRLMREIHSTESLGNQLEYGLEDVGESQSQAERITATFNNAYEAACAGDIKNVHGIAKLMELKQQYGDDDEESMYSDSDSEDEYELYPWQSELLHRMQSKPDKRTVHWYWEDTGNTGKTTMAKRLVKDHNAKVFGTTVVKSVAYEMAQLRKKRWAGNIIVFDITRGHADWDGIYSCIEMAKNRQFSSDKYTPTTAKFKRKFHVVVFANWPPKRNKLSQDRWYVRKINRSDAPVDDGQDYDTFKRQQQAEEFDIPSIK